MVSLHASLHQETAQPQPRSAYLQAQVVAGQGRVVLGSAGCMGGQPAFRFAPPFLFLRQKCSVGGQSNGSTAESEVY